MEFVGTARTHHDCAVLPLVQWDVNANCSTRITAFHRTEAVENEAEKMPTSHSTKQPSAFRECGNPTSHRCRYVAGNEIRCSGDDYLCRAHAEQCVDDAERQYPSISDSYASVGKDAGSLTRTCNDGTGAVHWWTDLRCRLLIALSVALERGSLVSLFST